MTSLSHGVACRTSSAEAFAVRLPEGRYHGTMFQLTTMARSSPTSWLRARRFAAVWSLLSSEMIPDPRAREDFAPGHSSSMRMRAAIPPLSGSNHGVDSSPRAALMRRTKSLSGFTTGALRRASFDATTAGSRLPRGDDVNAVLDTVPRYSAVQ